MNISINTKSGVPIYEQIERAFKDMIINGELKEGDSLPSIRGLASDMKISVITIKRAYEDLEKEGLIYSVQGKGFYVDNLDLQYMKEKKTLGLEEEMAQWIEKAKASGMNMNDAVDMLTILWSE